MDILRLLFSLYVICVTACEGKLGIEINSTADSKENEYIVKLASLNEHTTNSFQIKAKNSAMFTAVQSSKVGNNTIFLLKAESEMTSENVKEQIKNDFGDDVIYITRNYIVRATEADLMTYDCSSNPEEATCRTHSNSVNVWGLTRISNTAPFYEGATDHVYRWSDTNDGDDVTIYVIDSGVYLAHDEFSDVAARHGFTGLQLDEGSEDLNGHGTHVAGIAVGKQYGVAKRAALVSVKVLGEDGSGSLYDVLSGLSFVVSDFLEEFSLTGRRPKAVVNLSLGILGVVTVMDEALRHGSDMGIVYVAAAGNDAINACFTTPAGSPDAITVGAIDRSDALSWFSNYGSCVDILAPGEDILSADIDHSGDTRARQGTSMAAPFVAGVIARYLSHSVNASSTTCVKEHLFNTAIINQSTIPSQYPFTPNRILFSGCNTCFGDHECLPEFEDKGAWTMPPYPDNASWCLSFSFKLLAATVFALFVL